MMQLSMILLLLSLSVGRLAVGLSLPRRRFGGHPIQWLPVALVLYVAVGIFLAPLGFHDCHRRPHHFNDLPDDDRSP